MSNRTSSTTLRNFITNAAVATPLITNPAIASEAECTVIWNAIRAQGGGRTAQQANEAIVGALLLFADRGTTNLADYSNTPVPVGMGAPAISLTQFKDCITPTTTVRRWCRAYAE
jgi:hypothetical protein